MQLLYFNFSSLSSSPGSTACSLGRYVSVCSLLRWVLLLFAVFARTYMYIHARTAIRAAKVRKKIHIYKYMERKVRNFLTLYDFF